MRVLVTGVAGFIGSSTAEALLARGDEVVGLDDFSDAYDPGLKRRNVQSVARAGGAKFTLREGSITDVRFLDEVFSKDRFDVVLHLAARAGVRPSIEHPELYAAVNVGGTVNLLERMHRTKHDRIVFASSSSVYGGRTNVPFRETDPVDRPISPYAASKKACEVFAHSWHHLYGMNIAALRYFTVYGPRQRPDMAIHKFATLMRRGQSVPMYGDGSAARDFTFVDDAVRGTIGAIDHCEGFEIYNLGEEHTTTLRDLIDKIGRAIGIVPKIETLPLQAGDVPITYADVTKAKEKLGYRPSTTVDEGLARFAEWFAREGVR